MNAREAFEKWCASVGFSIQQEIDKPGSYFWSQTKKAWDMWEIAWKACAASHTAQESRGEEEVFRFEGYIDKYEDEDAYFVQPSTHEQEGIFANLYHAGSPNFTIVVLNPPVPQTVNVEEER